MTVQTIDHSPLPGTDRLRSSQKVDVPPPLNAGDRLSRAEFERRYQAHLEINKAELIEGVVHMPSPVHFTLHSQPHGDIVGWLAYYRAATPGVVIGDNATVRLDYENVEAQQGVIGNDDIGLRGIDLGLFVEALAKLAAFVSAAFPVCDRKPLL